MPLYDYRCRECGKEEERMVPADFRGEQLCVCTGVMDRIFITAPKVGKERYQMKALLNTGEHVAGHFGKQAPLYKGGKR